MKHSEATPAAGTQRPHVLAFRLGYSTHEGLRSPRRAMDEITAGSNQKN